MNTVAPNAPGFGILGVSFFWLGPSVQDPLIRVLTECLCLEFRGGQLGRHARALTSKKSTTETLTPGPTWNLQRPPTQIETAYPSAFPLHGVSGVWSLRLRL